MSNKIFRRHYHEDAVIVASPEKVFTYLDDHANLSSHMNTSSWKMGGGKMETTLDEGRGQKVGSHIRLSGKAFGMRISLDEVVTRHEPFRFKTWETVGTPELVVIGHYRMGIEITPQGVDSKLRVFIDYDLPEKNGWLGRLFGQTYARWCVRQMLHGVRDHFVRTSAL